MKITGELLKTERIRQNLTVQDIAQALKLSAKIINSLESGETEVLPAKTFIRGFVKSYAQYLKLDTTQVMNQFQEEMGSTHPLPKTPPPHQGSAETLAEEKAKQDHRLASEVTKSLNKDSSRKSFVYIGIATVLIIVIVIINKIVDRYEKETILDKKQISQIEPIQASPPTTTATAGNTSNLNDKLPEGSNTTQQPQADTSTNVEPNTEAKKPDSNQLKASNEKATAELSGSKPTTKPTVSLAPEDGFEPSSGKPVELIIEAKKDTEISYAKGNSKVFSKLKMTSKQIQVIRSSTGLHLKTEDGGAIHLMVNGIDKGQAGSTNKPVKLTF
jgi:cytoskeleton protein RodZ